MRPSIFLSGTLVRLKSEWLWNIVLLMLGPLMQNPKTSLVEKYSEAFCRWMIFFLFQSHKLRWNFSSYIIEDTSCFCKVKGSQQGCRLTFAQAARKNETVDVDGTSTVHSEELCLIFYQINSNIKLKTCTWIMRLSNEMSPHTQFVHGFFVTLPFF